MTTHELERIKHYLDAINEMRKPISNELHISITEFEDERTNNRGMNQ